MKKVMIVFGTRPEAIKMAPVIKELEKSPTLIPVVVVTGQHREMLDQVLMLFNIRVDYDLEVMKKNQTLTHITAEILRRLEPILQKEKPAIVLVHGDTTTTLAASIASFYQRIPIGHVEAGLRTHQKFSPYPEEMNRVLTDRLSDYYFAPTTTAKSNLIKEGICGKSIFVTGNTSIDAMKYTLSTDYSVSDLNRDRRNILVTMHRRENIGKPMEDTFKGILKIIESFPEVQVIFPVHRNPEVRKIVQKYFSGNEQVQLVEPFDVKEFHKAMRDSYIILTDSGGVQEEAPALNIPVLVLRDTTERGEGVISGALKVIGTNTKTVYEETHALLTNEVLYKEMSHAPNPYGDGRAANRILDIINQQC